MKTIKTIVYVDGFNLYYRLKNTPYRWLDINKLLNLILKEYHDIVKIKYFTATVKPPKWDPSKGERQRAYLRALQSIPNLEIIKGQFKKRQIKGQLLDSSGMNRGIKGVIAKTLKFILKPFLIFLKLNKGDYVRISKFEEKESDVNIASHILIDCLAQDIDCIILMSNDTDLKTPLAFARNKFGKKIGVISPQKIVHQDLQKISLFNKSISDKLLKKSLFPEAVGKVKKPFNW